MRGVADPRGIFNQSGYSFLETLAEVKKSENNILICGSFFIMKDVRKALGHPHDKPDQCDDEEINEV